MQFSVDDLLQKFLDDLKMRNLSDETIRTYRSVLEAFIAYADDRELELRDIELSDLRTYIGECVTNHGNTSVTVKKKINAIRQFMKWAVLANLLEYNPADDFDTPHRERSLPGMLDIETVNRIIDQPPPLDEKEQLLWVRDKAMLDMLYSSGLRVSELQSLTIKDIDLNRLLVRVTGKGNKTRIIPFGTKAKEAILNLLASYEDFKGTVSPNAFMFLSRYGRQLTVRQIRNRVAYQAKRAGLDERFHPHLLRHCFASHMLSNSRDLRAVQEMLGHANVSTTEIYTHLDFDNIASIYDQAHPRAALKK